MAIEADALAREKIDRLLKQAGWDKQSADGASVRRLSLSGTIDVAANRRLPPGHAHMFPHAAIRHTSNDGVLATQAEYRASRSSPIDQRPDVRD